MSNYENVFINQYKIQNPKSLTENKLTKNYMYEKTNQPIHGDSICKHSYGQGPGCASEWNR